LGALRRLDDAGIANIDGARSLVEWATAKLDLAPQNAQALVQASRIVTSDDSDRLERGNARSTVPSPPADWRLPAPMRATSQWPLVMTSLGYVVSPPGSVASPAETSNVSLPISMWCCNPIWTSRVFDPGFVGRGRRTHRGEGAPATF
ncbi:MAG: hypothetical protein WBV06_06170, partial [Acidimicrobiia bacterium]